MLARIVTPSTTIMTVQHVNGVYFSNSRRNSSQSSNEIDPYRARYERLWRQKATLDWLPKAEGDWNESNGKKQTYYNKILATGIISFVLSIIYLRTVIITRSGALTSPPYHLVGDEDFPGSKYDDTTELK
ncbi:unnamed protein product [Adineta ricciae]|uniref:Deltamethrin resistance protein prag01 domain-containing protein n=1 Tax=Adineta ricciae TaxID=249248 RepID=A0A814DZY2_ADIRI|nr:unnamed protein product [Adineta ricciae]CAF1211120.1 unnamed protein product [Adineta ricciae]